MNNPLILLIGVPFFGVCASLFSFKSRILFKYLKEFSFVLSLVSFCISIFILAGFNKNTSFFQFIYEIPWFTQSFYIPLSLGIDGISLILIILTCFLTPLCLLSSWDQIKLKDYPFFMINIFLIQFFLLLAFTVLDIFFFYIFFESILIPMFFLIGIWGSRERKIRAAYFFFLYTLFGSLFLLIFLGLILFHVGTTDYILLSHTLFDYPIQKIFWVGFFLSFAVKVPMIPFHIWLPEAHVEAPTIGSMILAGLLLKLGTYAFLRFSLILFPYANTYYTPVLFTLCILSIVFSSFTAIRQSDFKKIIAYSSIAHMNLVVLGIFSVHFEGLNGSVLQMVSHGFVSCGLFASIGVLYHRYHTRLIQYYSGVNHFMPIFTFFFLILVLANISLPGTSSFVGEFLLFLGIFFYSPFSTFLASFSLVFGGIYMLWLLNRICYTNVKFYMFTLPDLAHKEFIMLFSFVFFTILVGIKPDFLIDFYKISLISNIVLQSFKNVMFF